MKPIDFTVENRLPLPAVFFLIIVSIRKIIKGFWAIGVVFLAQEWRNQLGFIIKIGLALLLVVFIAIIRGVLLYVSFNYVVKNGELIVKKGVLNKTVLTIPLQRIQNISITQGFWQQLLHITTLSVDTAGSGEKEMEIYLDTETSNALKNFLKKSRAAVMDNDSSFTELEVPITEETEQQKYVYSATQLAVAAISRNHIKGLGIFIAVVYAFISQLGEMVMQRILDTVEPVMLANHSVQYWIFVVFSVFFLSVVVNFVHICLKYYDLTIVLYNDRIKYSGGLIKKMEKIINLDKIQIIRETTNLLEKMLNVSSMRLLQFLTFGKEAKSEVIFNIPGFLHSKELTQKIYPGFAEEEFSHYYPQKNYLYRNVNFYALYPALAIGLTAFIDLNMLWVTLLWLIIGSVCAYFRFKKSNAKIGDEYIVVSSGMLGDITNTIKIKNIQAVTLKQSIFQKRRKTASIIIATRWDHLTIPFVKETAAKDICDYLLYKIEA